MTSVGCRPAEYAYVSVTTSISHATPFVTVHEVGPFADLVNRNYASYLSCMARADRFDPDKRNTRSTGARTVYIRPATDVDYPRAFSLYNYETGQFEWRKPFAGGK